MKGFNIKKLVTIAVGAALVGSAVAPIAAAAFTDLTKSDVVDASGSPVVDIVVGSRAAVSDVVWAGNIAAKLAQLATKTTAVTGGAGAASPTVSDISVTVAVGGTTTVTGGKTFFTSSGSTSDFNSASLASSEPNFTDQNVTNSNVPALKYYGSKAYTLNNTSYTTTMQEKLNFTVTALYDSSTNKAIVAKVLQGKLKYLVDLGSGVPAVEAIGGGANFADDKNDNVLIPFFGKDYLVKSVSKSSGLIELVETSGDKDYKEGDKIESLTDANGNTYYVKVGPGGVDGTTNKVKLDIYDSADNRIDGGYYSTGDVTFYKNGQAFLATSLNISAILKASVSQSDVFTATIYVGTSRLLLYDSKGYPYDSSKAADDYDYTTALTWSADNNYLTTIAIVNSSRKVWNASTALKVGASVNYPNNVGSLKIVGFQLPGGSASKSERTTVVTIGSTMLEYKDTTYEANHKIPFYKYVGELSDAGTSTFTVDGKTFWTKLSLTDVNVWASDATGGRVNVPDQNKCIGDGNYINGQRLNVNTLSASGGTAKFGPGNTTKNIGDVIDINGMQLKFSGMSLASSCIYLTADGNVTIKKDSSTGTLVQEIWYADENAATTAKVALAGASDVTASFTPMVDERTDVARVWLFMSDQNFTTQYNKKVGLTFTDTAENYGASVPYYLPNSTDLPSDLNGGASYNVNNYHIAEFKIDEQDGSETGVNLADYNVFIDTSTGGAVALPNAQLSYYGNEINYNPDGKADSSNPNWKVSENTSQSYPTTAYSDYGTYVVLSNHIATFTLPENKPQFELLISGTGTTTTTTGGEELTIAKGTTKSTTSGTTIEVKDINYTATCAAGSGSCAPSSFEQVVPVGKLVYTDDSPPAGKVIVVGGHLVNALAKGITEDTLAAAGDQMAEKLANGDIVVAGFTAADTAAAAQELINALDALTQ